jgi:hypothetical protein
LRQRGDNNLFLNVFEGLQYKFLHNQMPDYTSASRPDFRWLLPEVDFAKKDFVNQIFDIAEKYYKDLLAMI